MDSYAFCVEPFTEDVNGLLALTVLGNQFLRVADYSASKHQFGFLNVKEKRHVWVLSRLVMEMSRRPKTYEKYHIGTWVNRVYRQFTDRLFQVNDSDGKPMGYAHSVWSLIDFETRMPVNLESDETKAIHDAVSDENVPIAPSGRIRLSDDAKETNRIIAYSDLDINGHVNSICYMRMAIDQVFTDYPALVHPKSHFIQRIEVQYIRESYFDDKTLRIKTEQRDKDTFLVEIIRNLPDGTGSESVVKAAVTLLPFEG